MQHVSEGQFRVLFCPCHYLFDEVTEGSEFSWAFNIGDKIARRLPDSVVVTGSANLKNPKPYKIIELQPNKVQRDLSLLNAVRFNWKYALATRRVGRTDKFDIIHHVLPFALANTYNLAWLVERRLQAKLVLGPVQQLRAVDRDRMPRFRATPDTVLPGLLRPFLTVLSRRTIKRANKIIAVNEQAKNSLIASGAAAERIRIISPGVDARRFAPLLFSDKRSDRMELLVVGQLVERKGIDLVLKALAQVIQRRGDVNLQIVGDGPQRMPLDRLVSDLRLNSHVQFAGLVPTSEIHRYYRRAHIFVSMSRSEGFSTVCLEAMASGLAIVGSRVGGFEEAIQDGINGFIVTPGDNHELARKLLRLIENRALIEALGAAARRDVERSFDWDASIVPKYLEVYQEVVNE